MHSESPALGGGSSAHIPNALENTVYDWKLDWIV
jgi:hypothetical protein